MALASHITMIRDGALAPSAANDRAAVLNKEAARGFLDLIEPGGEFLFTLKPDPSDVPWPKGCPGNIYGTVDTVWPYVERFNNEVDRVGVFVTINRHPRIVDNTGKVRRSGAHVTAIRAVFIDVDDPDHIPAVEETLGHGPPPNATVFTARGRHDYWLIDGLPPEHFKSMQAAMAARFGSDPAITDAARIMRLPGTRHVKGRQVMVSCTIAHQDRLIADRLVMMMGLRLDEPRLDRKVPVVEALPAGFGAPSLRFADAGVGLQEFGAGIIEAQIVDARNAGLALANAGRLATRQAWRDLILFPFVALAQEASEHEDTIKVAFDEISAASAVMGANVAANDEQWDVQITTASQGKGRTLASTFAAAGEVNAAKGRVTDPGNSLDPAVHTLSGIAVPAPRSRPLDLAAVPPHRRWVLGHRLLRGEITILAAPGGRGKSAVAVAWACSLAAGRRLVGEYVHGAPKRVLYISTEDSTEELSRRFYAAARAHKLTAADLAGVRVLGVNITRLALTATGERGAPTISLAGMQALQEVLADAEADVVILDPLGPLIPAGLNDNGLVASLMAQLKALAVRGDFALLILHHFKKGSDGSAEAVGGASAIVNFARAAFSIAGMSDREAGAFGILPSERWRHLRMTDLKVNLAPPADAADWLTLSSVTLPNAEPPTYPHGESVQAVVPFVPPPTGAAAAMLDAAQRSAVEVAFIRRVREAHEAGRAFYCTRQGASTAGMLTPCEVLAEVLGGATGRPLTDCRRLAEPILADLMARAVVVEAQITTANRHKRRGLIVGPGASSEG